MITVRHEGPESVKLGIVAAEQVASAATSILFEEALSGILAARRFGLSVQEEAWRQSVRDILRNGSYKPTGRGKPASEYLVRAAGENQFPRINYLVDVCNYISLFALLPVSLWDLDRAETDEYLVRLGREDEAYVFNTAGQEIGLKDLLLCCQRTGEYPEGLPIVNPVKDSMLTKTTDETTRVGAIVYSRLEDGPSGSLEEICDRFGALLARSYEDATATAGIILPGESLQL